MKNSPATDADKPRSLAPTAGQASSGSDSQPGTSPGWERAAAGIPAQPDDDEMERLLGPRLFRATHVARWLGNLHPRTLRDRARSVGIAGVRLFGTGEVFFTLDEVRTLRDQHTVFPPIKQGRKS